MSSSSAFPYLLNGDAKMPVSSSSPSTSSSFSIDTLLSSPLSLPQFPASANGSEGFVSGFPWQMHPSYPFFSMLCSPLLPQFMPPYQHFVSRRKRRHRTIFSEEQLSILESTFVSTHYPDVATREKLAIQCALKEERVEVWFKNRRAKERKQKREDGVRKGVSDNSECDDSDEEVRKVKKIKKEKESSSPESKPS
ncbi:unnamed protein product [Caenorhabditis bovis]|uniref:Homeobox domain-containing protein n=1 Tax=Caenorhabditis bovis TaxID=2654633 RepID=A0A8S1F9V8_9PELO|nr:unnamed protein product [Caenorhabditis bovis]